MDDVAQQVERLARHLADNPERARAIIDATFKELGRRDSATHVRWLRELSLRVAHPDPQVGARLALLAGGLVEHGLPAEPLAVALAEPLKQALRDALRFYRACLVGYKAGFGLQPDAEAPPPEADGGPSDAVKAEAWQTVLRATGARDPEGASAFASLEIWYLPVVAAWTRQPQALKAAQADVELMQILADLEHIGGSYWIAILGAVSLEQDFVLLVPELNEGYRLRLDGVADIGQLMVLLSEPFGALLGRLGVDETASSAMLQVMRGDGPQSIDASYSAAFQLYPWQALDLESGVPLDGRFRWRAPGGAGTHSLPADFQPSAVEPLDGVRVLLLTGPRTQGQRFNITRQLAGARSFEALRASLSNVRQLSAEELADCWRRLRKSLAN